MTTAAAAVRDVPFTVAGRTFASRLMVGTGKYRDNDTMVRAIEASGAETRASIVHEWNGPAWPLIGRPAAQWVIGPVFIHGIASRTLAGIARQVEHRAI